MNSKIKPIQKALTCPFSLPIIHDLTWERQCRCRRTGARRGRATSRGRGGGRRRRGGRQSPLGRRAGEGGGGMIIAVVVAAVALPLRLSRRGPVSVSGRWTVVWPVANLPFDRKLIVSRGCSTLLRRNKNILRVTSQMTVYYVILRIIWHFFGLKRDYGESLVYGIIRAKWQNNAVYGSPGPTTIPH